MNCDIDDCENVKIRVREKMYAIERIEVTPNSVLYFLFGEDSDSVLSSGHDGRWCYLSGIDSAGKLTTESIENSDWAFTE